MKDETGGHVTWKEQMKVAVREEIKLRRCMTWLVAETSCICFSATCFLPRRFWLQRWHFLTIDFFFLFFFFYWRPKYCFISPCSEAPMPRCVICAKWRFVFWRGSTERCESWMYKGELEFLGRSMKQKVKLCGYYSLPYCPGSISD